MAGLGQAPVKIELESPGSFIEHMEGDDIAPHPDLRAGIDAGPPLDAGAIQSDPVARPEILDVGLAVDEFEGGMTPRDLLVVDAHIGAFVAAQYDRISEFDLTDIAVWGTDDENERGFEARHGAVYA